MTPSKFLVSFPLPSSSHHAPRALPQEGNRLPPSPPFSCIDLHGNEGKEDRVLPPPLQFPPPWASQPPHAGQRPPILGARASLRAARHASGLLTRVRPSALWPTPAQDPGCSRLPFSRRHMFVCGGRAQQAAGAPSRACPYFYFYFLYFR